MFLFSIETHLNYSEQEIKCKNLQSHKSVMYAFAASSWVETENL